MAASANASPESLRTTRFQRAEPSPAGEIVIRSAPDLDLGEAIDRGVAEELFDRHLRVAHELLLEQHALGEEASDQLAFDDLGDRLLGFALVARLGLEDLAFLLDVLGRHLVPR